MSHLARIRSPVLLQELIVQPQSTRTIDVKQQTTALTLGPGIRLRLGALRMAVIRGGLPCSWGSGRLRTTLGGKTFFTGWQFLEENAAASRACYFRRFQLSTAKL